MRKIPAIGMLAFLLIGFRTIAADVSPQPLDAVRLVALIAGNGLPDFIANEIKNDGLTFQPDARYLAVLKTIGASDPILSALQNAQIAADPRLSALLQKNYPVAEKFYFRAVDTDEKAYGESSDRVAASLVAAIRVFVVQQQYDKAEPLILRAERIDESLYGPDNPGIMIPLWTLCNVYDKESKSDQAAECYGHTLRIGEKQFGPDSPQLAEVLALQAKELRASGHSSEADQAETRAAKLRSATMSPKP